MIKARRWLILQISQLVSFLSCIPHPQSHLEPCFVSWLHLRLSVILNLVSFLSYICHNNARVIFLSHVLLWSIFDLFLSFSMCSGGKLQASGILPAHFRRFGSFWMLVRSAPVPWTMLQCDSHEIATKLSPFWPLFGPFPANFRCLFYCPDKRAHLLVQLSQMHRLVQV